MQHESQKDIVDVFVDDDCSGPSDKNMKQTVNNGLPSLYWSSCVNELVKAVEKEMHASEYKKSHYARFYTITPI